MPSKWLFLFKIFWIWYKIFLKMERKFGIKLKSNGLSVCASVPVRGTWLSLDLFMANQAWLESSLRRSASLGLEVLERASRRTVDWTSTRASQTPITTEEDAEIPVKVPVSVYEPHRQLNYLWLFCSVLFLLVFSQSSCSYRFSENTLRARRCLCNHRRLHGPDDPSVQGQRLFACTRMPSATDL